MSQSFKMLLRLYFEIHKNTSLMTSVHLQFSICERVLHKTPKMQRRHSNLLDEVQFSLISQPDLLSEIHFLQFFITCSKILLLKERSSVKIIQSYSGGIPVLPITSIFQT